MFDGHDAFSAVQSFHCDELPRLAAFFLLQISDKEVDRCNACWPNARLWIYDLDLFEQMIIVTVWNILDWFDTAVFRMKVLGQ